MILILDQVKLRSHGILSHVSHRPPSTHQILFKSKKLFVDGQKDTETGFIRSTQRGRLRKPQIIYFEMWSQQTSENTANSMWESQQLFIHYTTCSIPACLGQSVHRPTSSLQQGLHSLWSDQACRDVWSAGLASLQASTRRTHASTSVNQSHCSAVTILKSRSNIAIFCQNRPKSKSLHLLVMFRLRHVSIFCSN